MSGLIFGFFKRHWATGQPAVGPIIPANALYDLSGALLLDLSGTQLVDLS